MEVLKVRSRMIRIRIEGASALRSSATTMVTAKHASRAGTNKLLHYCTCQMQLLTQGLKQRNQFQLSKARDLASKAKI